MGFKIPIIGDVIKGITGGGQKAAPAPAPAATPSTSDAAKEEERRRLLARGLTPLTATSALGDTSAANLGRKALLGV